MSQSTALTPNLRSRTGITASLADLESVSPVVVLRFTFTVPANSSHNRGRQVATMWLKRFVQVSRVSLHDVSADPRLGVRRCLVSGKTRSRQYGTLARHHRAKFKNRQNPFAPLDAGTTDARFLLKFAVSSPFLGQRGLACAHAATGLKPFLASPTRTSREDV